MTIVSNAAKLSRSHFAFVLGSAAALAIAATGAAPAAATSAEKFPHGFMWGVAGAGFQTEMGGGAANSDQGSDWWSWVRDAQNISTGHVSGDLPENGPGGWKTSFAGDIKLAKGLGMNSWRMGTEWSRIFPRSTAAVKLGPKITPADLTALDKLAAPAAIAKYRAIIKAARAAGLRPFVTLSHFTLPLWIHDPIAVRDALAGRGPDDPLPANLPAKAGWLSAATVDEFRKYAAYMAWKFGGLVDWWAPLNEPMVVAVGGFVNVPGAYANWFPPGANSFTGSAKAIENMAAANSVAYDALRAIDRADADRDGHATRVGLVQNMIHFVPSDPTLLADIASTKHADQIFNRFFPDAAIKGIFDRNVNGVIDAGEKDPRQANKADFFGVNYYFRGRITSLGVPLSSAIGLLDFLPRVGYKWAGNPAGAPCPSVCSDFGSELDIDGFGSVLSEAASYGKPLLVTENGIADAADAKRPKFLVQSLHKAWQTATRKPGGVPLLGWMHWSLVDNFEWSAGYKPRFGLYSYSPTTLRRRPRPSAATVRSIARGNAIPGALLDRWVK